MIKKGPCEGALFETDFDETGLHRKPPSSVRICPVR